MWTIIKKIYIYKFLNILAYPFVLCVDYLILEYLVVHLSFDIYVPLHMVAIELTGNSL